MRISKQQILTQISEEDIYRHYCNDFDINNLRKNVTSVFKKDESTPSLNFYKQKGTSRLLYKCHSTGYTGDCYQFVADLKGLDNRNQFDLVLEQIATDMRLNMPTYYESKDKDWQAKYYEKFTKAGAEFWTSYGVHSGILLKYRVRQLKELIYDNRKTGKKAKFHFEKEKHLAYEFDIDGRKKLYIPKQSGIDKYFIKNQTKDDIFGLRQLPSFKSTYILICEGEKDVLVASANGIPAVCFQSSNTLPTKSQIRELLKRCAYLIVCYDNDEAGRKGADKLCDTFELVRYELGDNYNDIAEYLPRADAYDFKDLLFQSITAWRKEKNIEIWEADNCYWKMDRKGNQIQVSNFIVQLDAMIMGRDHPERLLRLVSNQYHTSTLSAPVKVFSSEQSFSNFCECQKGNFLFHGTKGDLQEIKRKVFHLSDYLEEATTYGWNSERNLFIMQNGVIQNGRFYQPDKNGIWKDLYIRTASENYEIVSNEINLEYKSGKSIDGKKLDLKDFINMVVDSFGQHVAITSLAYLFSTVVFDFIIKKFRAFPMLNIEGQRGTGKGSLIKMIMMFYTTKVQEVSLQNTTRNFITRRMEHQRNVPVWFDEFTNGLNESIIQTLKNFYDLIGRSKAQYTSGNETSTSKILSPAIITGEEAPKHNEALFSRLIVLTLPPLEKSLERTNNFLKRMMDLENGISHILAEIYDFREVIIAEYEETYNELMTLFYRGLTDMDVQADTRIIKNYASIFTPMIIMADHNIIDLEKEKIATRALVVMADHQRSQVVYDEVNIFLENIMQMNELSLSHPCVIREDHDYHIDHNNNFFIRKGVFQKWGKYYRELTGRVGKDPTAIETYILHKNYSTGRKKKYFYVGDTKKQCRCLSFDIDLMPDFFKDYFKKHQDDF